ncbi:ribosome biogenesis GTPase Der [Ponticaulis sp.]|uniref:ribosome biogenesis GTPase Der n=1 Tax=Ponticaulis sp. TaxID=2020902 RepID=UPI000C570811|nr:ribosome biogenesis GTPase Der [Ponticaulis sp.]MAJ08442.1 ribosome biogenesis GTPase Der [Ponticaulis sp.]|tara:strand:+ start:38740 stop:40125 length:1386 start_codon:yes stop_codon:yes gene_type:complete
MPLKVAIVGRPNVGKSTLFNRLAGQRLAIVDDQPGVTRDRRETPAELAGMKLLLIDTPGFEDVHDTSLEARMRQQTEQAIKEADVSLFIVDARSGVTPLDERFAELLRRADKPVVLAANKCEGRQAEEGLMEAFALGFGEPVALSAEHGEGLAELFSAIVREVPESKDQEEEIVEREAPFDPDAEELPPPPKTARLIVVGRPNAGKSTLINQLLQSDRLLTGPEAGITRDSIEVAWEYEGRTIKLVDTAGLRKRAKVHESLEKMSTSDTIRSIRFADIVALVMDARDAFEKQDLQIADLCVREGRGLVMVISKWDLVENPDQYAKHLREKADRLLPNAKGAPVVFLSGLTGKRIDRMMPAVMQTFDDWNARVKTKDLNDWLRHVVERHPPPSVHGKPIKPKYMSQIKTRPPTFVLMANRGENMPEAYKRYLVNGLREAFDLKGVPIRLYVRQGKNPYADKG